MVLRVKPQREPFARTPGPAVVVRGSTYHRLRASLEKYCRGRTLGRSFVVSGNRGVGKTTMVLAAIEDLRRQSEVERRERPPDPGEEYPYQEQLLKRPLLVSLNGPDIVRERARPTKVKSGTQSGDPQSTNGTTQSSDETTNDVTTLKSHLEDSDNLLCQITRALHVAIAKEFAVSFQRSLPDPYNREWLEASAQLRLELAAGAKVDGLRRFWDLSGRFSQGILFKQPPERPPGAHVTDDQGLRELVALDVSADAFRIAIGKVTQDTNQVLENKTGETEPAWTSELKTIAAPLAGLAGGAATGFGVLHVTGGQTVSSVAGSIGAALLSGLALTFGIAPMRKTTSTTTSKFSPDTGVGSLSWRLGRVVDELFEAGLAPVFVIDELDKGNLGEWIGDRAQELKTLLTERTFFCFLTGRGYADKLHRERTERTYPPSYTQFSNYLFVNYLPQDLHDYLREILEFKADNKDSKLDAHQAIEHAILPFIVLFRAEMHPIDIQRELNALIEKGDDIQLFPVGQSLPKVDSFALLFQIAVEAVLADKEIERRMRDDPRFALLAVDAVYYAPRMWRRGVELDISETALDKYFRERRAPDDKQPKDRSDENAKKPGDDENAKKSADDENAKKSADDENAKKSGEPSKPEPGGSRTKNDAQASGDDELMKLPESDQLLLRKCVVDLVRLIEKVGRVRGDEGVVMQPFFVNRLVKKDTNPEKQRANEAEAYERRATVLNALPAEDDALLGPTDETQTKFSWCYDIHGLPIASKATMEYVKGSARTFRALEKEVNAPLLEKSKFGFDAAESRFSLLQHGMKWTEAHKLVEKLEQAPSVGEVSTQLGREARSLVEYTSVATAAIAAIGGAILLHRVLAPNKVMPDGLAFVTEALELSQLSNDKRASRVAATLTALLSEVSPPSTTFSPWNQVSGFKTALESLLASAATLKAPQPDVRLQRFFENWRLRLDARLRGAATPVEPSWADVAMLLDRNGQQTLIARAWTGNSAAAWTEMLLSGETRKAASDGLLYPSQWSGRYAAAILGATALALRLPESNETGALASFLNEKKEAHTRRFVVVVAAEPSELEIPTWLVSTAHAALVVSASQLPSLSHALDAVSSDPVAFGANPWLIVEGTEATGLDTPENLLSAELGLARLFPPARRIQVFAKEPKRRLLQVLKTPPRHFVGARSIDEAVSRADERAKQDQPSGAPAP